MIEIAEDITNFIEHHANDNPHVLALQSNCYTHIDMPFALQQIAGKQQAKHKIPLWYTYKKIIYPKHISLEQCSSQKTAEYKAQLCVGTSLVDLTGGLGVDFFFMTQGMQHATYVETQPELVEIARHNFEVLNLKATLIEDDAIHFLETMPAVDTIYIDPARRSISGRKTVFIEDCTPNLIEIASLLQQKAGRIIIKLSPMLDISMALKSLRFISSVHILSVDNECKELLFVADKANAKLHFTSVNILNNSETQFFSFTKEDEENAIPNYTSTMGQYIYEPNASILKAGAYRYLATFFNLSKLNKNSHLYTSDALIKSFPGRIFAVKNIVHANKREMKLHFEGLGKANITVRNFPMTVDDIRKKTGLKDGGDRYIFATTLFDERKVFLICEKIIIP